MKNSNDFSNANCVNGSVAWGYKYNGVGRPYSIDENKAFFVRLIFELYIKRNMSPREIANHLNDKELFNYWRNIRVWTDKAIRYVLTNESYMGTYVYNRRKTDPKTGSRYRTPKELWGRVVNHHEAIIPKELFNYTQEIYQLRSNRLSRVKLIKKEVTNYLTDDETLVELTAQVLTEFTNHPYFTHFVTDKIHEYNLGDIYLEDLNSCIEESNVVELVRAKVLRMMERL